MRHPVCERAGRVQVVWTCPFRQVASKLVNLKLYFVIAIESGLHVMVNDLDIYAALRRLPKDRREELSDFLKKTGIETMQSDDLQERLGASASLKRALASGQMR